MAEQYVYLFFVIFFFQMGHPKFTRVICKALKSMGGWERPSQNKNHEWQKKCKNNKTKILRKRNGASECWFWSLNMVKTLALPWRRAAPHGPTPGA